MYLKFFRNDIEVELCVKYELHLIMIDGSAADAISNKLLVHTSDIAKI